MLAAVSWRCFFQDLASIKAAKRLFSSTRDQLGPNIAIVGSGPAGCYSAGNLLKKHDLLQVDVYEKLPAPFGLVRYGVAPDHPELKNVINQFTTTFTKNADRCRFIGNINVGEDITISELEESYDAVILAYGADCDKDLQIEGEKELGASGGVISAKEFVGWYNGHPDNRDLAPDLANIETAVIVGHGNVALDVARILLKPIDELASTDITSSALKVLTDSRAKKVHLVGRRGPLQMAFTIKELREMLNVTDCTHIFDPADFAGLDDLNCLELPRPRKRLTELIIKAAGAASSPTAAATSKSCHWKFCRSPVEIVAGPEGHSISRVKLAVNKLQPEGVKEWRNARAVSTSQCEEIPCELLIRSVGYRSVRIGSDLPFDQQQNVVINSKGRVRGNLYCTGWIKRGPTGVILSTLNDAIETSTCVLEDVTKNATSQDSLPGFSTISKLLNERGSKPIFFQDWLKIDNFEKSKGETKGKPREKVLSVKEMIEIVEMRT